MIIYKLQQIVIVASKLGIVYVLKLEPTMKRYTTSFVRALRSEDTEIACPSSSEVTDRFTRLDPSHARADALATRKW